LELEAFDNDDRARYMGEVITRQRRRAAMTRACAASVLVLLLAVLGGCTAALKGSPDPIMDPDVQLKALEPYLAPAIEDGYRQELDPAKKRVLRDEIIDRRIQAQDIKYDTFERAIYREGVTGNILLDWATLGLSGAIATVGGAGLKAALGAMSGGLIGAKAAVDRNAFFEQSVPAIIAQMNAQRLTVLVRIRDGQTKDTVEYPLDRALADLRDYARAGALAGALEGITENAGATAKRSREVLFELRNKGFFEQKRQARVDAIVAAIKALPNMKALSLIANPPVAATAKINQALDARDPNRQRMNNAAAAREALIMMALLSDRTDDNLDAWEAALKAA
jgi:hypothetical protein